MDSRRTRLSVQTPDRVVRGMSRRARSLTCESLRGNDRPRWSDIHSSIETHSRAQLLVLMTISQRPGLCAFLLSNRKRRRLKTARRKNGDDSDRPIERSQTLKYGLKVTDNPQLEV